MTHEVIIAGFGGQGVLLIGRLLTYAGMLDGKEVSWIPAYGPEMRGGTASCSVIVSEQAIGSPVVTAPTVLVAMNQPSLARFEPAVQAAGTVIVNGSLIKEPVTRTDLQVYSVSVHELALELGNVRYANMVALGALVSATGLISLDSLDAALVRHFANKPGAAALNMQAVRRGGEFVRVHF